MKSHQQVMFGQSEQRPRTSIWELPAVNAELRGQEARFDFTSQVGGELVYVST